MSVLSFIVLSVLSILGISLSGILMIAGLIGAAIGIIVNTMVTTTLRRILGHNGVDTTIELPSSISRLTLEPRKRSP